MKRVRAIVLALLMVLSIVPAALPQSASALEVSRPVLAYYFGWWGAETWYRTPDMPPVAYSSNDDNTMRRQIREAKGAGITGFICTWRYNCVRLLQLAEAEGNFAVTFSVDPVADSSLNSYQAVVNQMREMNGLTGNKAYLRWGGKPVFVFWNQNVLPGDSSVAAFQRLRTDVDPGRNQFWLGGGDNFSYLDAYDAIHFFQTSWSSTVGPGDAMASYNRKLNEYNASRGTAKPFVATVMPGYNDLPYRGGHSRDREGGNYYRASWDAALSYRPKMVIITSWNEWYEGSQIEPSVSYGNLYLDITREKTGAYRSQPRDFADSNFQRTWNRTDKAITDGVASRSWVWGPAFSDGMWEGYNGGGRLVQYFDKSRMEVNNPNGDRNSPWFVTNGLLASELIEGRVQVGDSAYEQRSPSNQVLAGDPRAINPGTPGYAALRGKTGRAPDRTGQGVGQQLFADGRVSDIGAPMWVPIERHIPETGHNIPNVFWGYMNQTGPVWDGSRYVNAPVMDWLFTFGYPITEPYWTWARVGGQDKWVLVQAFERRILTFTPSNSAAFQVEMGNVGQHYYDWRYGSGQ